MIQKVSNMLLLSRAYLDQSQKKYQSKCAQIYRIEYLIFVLSRGEYESADLGFRVIRFFLEEAE